MVRLQEQKGRHFLTVPAEISRLKGWKKGQELIWLACDNGDIRLKEIK